MDKVLGLLLVNAFLNLLEEVQNPRLTQAVMTDLIDGGE